MIFQGLVVIAFSFFAVAAAAQNPTHVPKSGSWTLDARQSHRHFSTFQAGHPMSITVNTCGDRVILNHPSLIPSRMVLSYEPNSGHYEGAGSFRDPEGRTAPISWSLRARSATRLQGRANMNLPTGVMSLDPLIMRLGDEYTYAEELGSGEIRPGRTSVENEGRFYDDVRRYAVILTEFKPRSADLLANHMYALREAQYIMTTPPDGYQDARGKTYCRTSSSVGLVEGFGDRQGLEKDNWADLAAYRAGNTARQFAFTGSTGRLQVNVNPDFPGAGGMGTCQRAAIAHVTVRHRWFTQYTKEDSENWLRGWLEGAGRAYEGEEQVIARARARETFCFAEGMRQRAEAGQCPSGPVELAAMETKLSSGEAGRATQVYKTYEHQLRQSTSGEYLAVTPGDRSIVQNEGTKDLAGCSPESIARAKEIEMEIFGDVAPGFGEETGSVTGADQWLDEKADWLTDSIEDVFD